VKSSEFKRWLTD
jgi:antitoxin HicB